MKMSELEVGDILTYPLGSINYGMVGKVTSIFVGGVVIKWNSRPKEDRYEDKGDTLRCNVQKAGPTIESWRIDGKKARRPI